MMYLRRLLTAVGAGLLTTGFAVAALPPAAAAAAPAAPKGFAVARAADDARKITVAWKPAADAHHYVVSTIGGSVETVVNLSAATQSYVVDAPDSCTSYKIKVGAADVDGATTWTGVWTIKALTPAYVAGMATGRADDGTTLTASWRTPAWIGYTPLTGYRVVVSRTSDGVVLSDTTSMDTSLRFPGVDPGRAYNVAVGTINDFGSCNTAKSMIDRYRPGDPTGLVVQRQADAPGSVQVIWRAPASGPAPTYYTVGYGESKATKTVRVDAPATATTLTLDPAKAWAVEIKAFNANGGSGALAGTVPVYDSAAVTPPAQGTGPDESRSSTTVPTGNDRTPPTIITSLSPAPQNGYFRTPPTVHFTCADNSGQIAVCPADKRLDTDGVAQKVSGTAVDQAGNTATVTLSLNVDQVAPVISSTVTGTKSADGWFNAPPTVRYTCSDTVSGVNTLAICPTAATITADGLGQRITGTATDKAGNIATDTIHLDIDRAAPAITATVLGIANPDGWYPTAPTVHFTCTDALSGIAVCPADRTIAAEGAGHLVTGTAVDRAGNTATASVTVNVDETAPAIMPDVRGDFGTDGWFRGTPTLHWDCTDAGTGVRDCTADSMLGEGEDQVITGSTTDRAGNTAEIVTVVSVDNTAPAITASVLGTPGPGGWFATAPTVRFTCSDALSGVAVCPADVPAATGVVSGTATDKAGNTASASVSLKLDQDAPVITATVLGTPQSGGWFAAAPTVRFTCSDASSGVAVCPADVPAATGVVSGTATDKAGNTASAAITVNVDRAGPDVTVIGAANGAKFGPDAAPAVSCGTADSGSGVSVPATMTHVSNDRGVHVVTCSGAVDMVGNTTAPVTVTYWVDASVETLIALTNRYLQGHGASQKVQQDFTTTLTKRQFAAYMAKVLAGSVSRKPMFTAPEAATLLWWAVGIAVRG